jgi:2,3-bisphosphoglycerate-dependent phosphoglycerate mutase
LPASEFERVVAETWRSPEIARAGGESNVEAQTRGLAAVRNIVTRHTGHHVVVSTHGNLLALILNGLDSTFGYQFWRRLSFPDVYRLDFEGTVMIRVERIWKGEQLDALRS